MKSRAVLIVGMHRSGTSAVARGLKALSVDLGDSFLDAQPENPTGYWEDKGIVEIDERVLKTLGIAWDDVTPIPRSAFRAFRLRLQRNAAVRYLRRSFGSKPLWGFKDPRTIRLLPFWQDALRGSNIDDAYVVAIRNPRSIAASLYRRQAMDAATAYRLWLVHMVPFLRDLRDKPAVVVDYDLLMREPRAQLERIAARLQLPFDRSTSIEVDRFAAKFLDERLRHSVFQANDADVATPEGRLAHEAYALLRERAEDGRAEADEPFWAAWQKIEHDLDALLERG